MSAWHQAKKEILLAIYHHQLLTPYQLALLLGYQQSSIHRIGKELLKQQWIRSVQLSFLQGNTKGYVLTATGAKVAAQLYGETDTYLSRMEDPIPAQLEHSYGTNAFFIGLITSSLTRPNEGLIEWLGTKDAAERYASLGEKGKKKWPLRPDGLGVYQFADGRRVVMHLEYDTGSESLWRLQDKMFKYGEFLRKHGSSRITSRCSFSPVVFREGITFSAYGNHC